MNSWKHKEWKHQGREELMKLKEEICNKELLKIKEFGQKGR